MIELFVTVTIWGLSFALAKMALNTWSPFELVFLRLSLGFLIALPLAFFWSREKFLFKKEWKLAFIIGSFEFAGTYLLYTLSLSYLPSSVVAVLTLLTPIFTYAVGILFGIDRKNLRGVCAILLSCVGAMLCIPSSGHHFEISDTTMKGVVLILLSNLSFAIGNVWISRLEKKSLWRQTLTVKSFLVASVMTGVVCAFANHFWPPPTALFEKSWVLPLYLGCIATGLGFFLWNQGVQKVSSFRASIVGNFKAPISVIWGALLLTEPVTYKLITGLVCLISASHLVTSKK